MIRRFLCIAICLVFALLSQAQAGTMTGWDIGWNDMATVSGGTVDYGISDDGSLQYVNIVRAHVSFNESDMYDGGLGYYVENGNYHLGNYDPEGQFDQQGSYSWANASGDADPQTGELRGQHFFDGAIRNSWYTGIVPGLTAYDYNGSYGDNASGTYEWLLNNYARDGEGEATGDPKNSWIRGTGSSFTYDQESGDFTAEMTSNGTWFWYTDGTPDSQMSGWIKDWDISSWDTEDEYEEYYGRYMTGNFRLVGTFTDEDGLPTFETATLQYEVAAVPLPPSVAMLGLGLVGAGGFGWLRRRRS